MSCIDRLHNINLDLQTLSLLPSTAIKECTTIISEILDHNDFKVVKTFHTPLEGPYQLTLYLYNRYIIFEINDHQRTNSIYIALVLSSFQNILKSYANICKSYSSELKKLPFWKLETIDMGRRGLHNAGADQLKTHLQDKIDIDHETARRLFSLICILHFKGSHLPKSYHEC